MPNLFDEYFDLLGKTEAPVVCHRWSLITCIGALLGRQAWLPFGPHKIFPNVYAMIIGESGTRKSTAIKLAKKELSKAGYDQFSAQKTTKEKFLMDLEGLQDSEDEQVGHAAVMENLFGADSGAGSAPREVFIVSDEFNDFMSCRDMEFQSLLGSLWDWNDEEKSWKHRLKNSASLSIYQPTISILGGNTHENFASMFPPEAIGQGFLSRMLLIYCEPTGVRIPIPSALNEVKEKAFLEKLRSIALNFRGTIEFTNEAFKIYEVLYRTFKPLDDIRFNSYSTRRHVHLIKLCLICCAARVEDNKISVADIYLANTILCYLEHFMPKALGEFGKARNNDVANTIIQILNKTDVPQDEKALMTQVGNNLDRPEDLMKLLYILRDAGKIQYVRQKSTGAVGWLIKNRVLGAERQLYVDYNLLKEYRDGQL